MTATTPTDGSGSSTLGRCGRLRPGGVLATDDADASYAFSVFCSAVGMQAHYLLDQRKIFKVFGAARIPHVG